MWILLGLVGALWFVGFVVVPDKNQPPMSQAHPPAVASTATPGAPQQPH
jgi:hypothetical protein